MAINSNCIESLISDIFNKSDIINIINNLPNSPPATTASDTVPALENIAIPDAVPPLDTVPTPVVVIESDDEAEPEIVILSDDEAEPEVVIVPDDEVVPVPLPLARRRLRATIMTEEEEEEMDRLEAKRRKEEEERKKEKALQKEAKPKKKHHKQSKADRVAEVMYSIKKHNKHPDLYDRLYFTLEELQDEEIQALIEEYNKKQSFNDYYDVDTDASDAEFSSDEEKDC